MSDAPWPRLKDHWVDDLQTLPKETIEAIDKQLELTQFLVGVEENRPDPLKTKGFFLAQDSGVLYHSAGIRWLGLSTSTSEPIGDPPTAPTDPDPDPGTISPFTYTTKRGTPKSNSATETLALQLGSTVYGIAVGRGNGGIAPGLSVSGMESTGFRFKVDSATRVELFTTKVTSQTSTTFVLTGDEDGTYQLDLLQVHTNPDDTWHNVVASSTPVVISSAAGELSQIAFTAGTTVHNATTHSEDLGYTPADGTTLLALLEASNFGTSLPVTPNVPGFTELGESQQVSNSGSIWLREAASEADGIYSAELLDGDGSVTFTLDLAAYSGLTGTVVDTDTKQVDTGTQFAAPLEVTIDRDCLLACAVATPSLPGTGSIPDFSDGSQDNERLRTGFLLVTGVTEATVISVSPSWTNALDADGVLVALEVETGSLPKQLTLNSIDPGNTDPTLMIHLVGFDGFTGDTSIDFSNIDLEVPGTNNDRQIVWAINYQDPGASLAPGTVDWTEGAAVPATGVSVAIQVGDAVSTPSEPPPAGVLPKRNEVGPRATATSALYGSHTDQGEPTTVTSGTGHTYNSSSQIHTVDGSNVSLTGKKAKGNIVNGADATFTDCQFDYVDQSFSLPEVDYPVYTWCKIGTKLGVTSRSHGTQRNARAGKFYRCEFVGGGDWVNFLARGGEFDECWFHDMSKIPNDSQQGGDTTHSDGFQVYRGHKKDLQGNYDGTTDHVASRVILIRNSLLEAWSFFPEDGEVGAEWDYTNNKLIQGTRWNDFGGHVLGLPGTAIVSARTDKTNNGNYIDGITVDKCVLDGYVASIFQFGHNATDGTPPPKNIVITNNSIYTRAAKKRILSVTANIPKANITWENNIDAVTGKLITYEQAIAAVA